MLQYITLALPVIIGIVTICYATLHVTYAPDYLFEKEKKLYTYEDNSSEFSKISPKKLQLYSIFSTDKIIKRDIKNSIRVETSLKEKIKLLGIIKKIETEIAIIENMQSGEIIYLRKSHSIFDWTLDQILEKKIILIKENEIEELILNKF